MCATCDALDQKAVSEYIKLIVSTASALDLSIMEATEQIRTSSLGYLPETVEEMHTEFAAMPPYMQEQVGEPPSLEWFTEQTNQWISDAREIVLGSIRDAAKKLANIRLV